MYKELESLIRAHYSTPEDFIPLHEPRFRGKEKEYLLETIDSTFVSSVGAFVDRFEAMMCEITGASHAVAAVNGTSALHIALVLAGVKPDSEVITQPLSFVATCNAISYQLAHPHFVDVDLETMGMSPVALENRLKDIAEPLGKYCLNKYTKRPISAIVPMHTFGHPVDIEGIIEVAAKYKIPVIEDAAESLGSRVGNQHTGTFGSMGAFSFNGNKTVTSGGGGALVTNDEAIAKQAKHLTTTAKLPHRWEYRHDSVGYNYRMPNLNAALACAQLEQLNDFISDKRETALKYQEFFKGYDDVHFMSEPNGTTSNYWLNAIQLKDFEAREQMLKSMNDAGIMTRPIWTLMNELTMFEVAESGELPNAKKLSDTIVNIPSSVR